MRFVLFNSALLLLGGCATGPRVVQDFPPVGHAMPAHELRFDWHVEETHGEEFVGYRLQVAADKAFEQLEFDKVVAAPPLSLPLSPGTWYWRVRGRYKTVGARVRETGWSDVVFSEGRFVHRRHHVLAMPRRPATSKAAASKTAPGKQGGKRAGNGGDAGTKQRKSAQAAKRGARAAAPAHPKRPANRAPKVVAAHKIKPALEAFKTIAVSSARRDGKADEALTREIVVRLFALQKLVLLEGVLKRVDGPRRGATGGQHTEPRFVLDPGQPTPMLPPNAVRLTRPEAVLQVRLNTINIDPAALPRPPSRAEERPGFNRFEGGTRVLNATLVAMSSGHILWSGSLYAREGVSDLTLLDELVRRYFK